MKKKKKISDEEINFMILAGDLNKQNDWERLITEYELTEQQIDRYVDKLNWYTVSVCQKLPDFLIDKYQDKLY